MPRGVVKINIDIEALQAFLQELPYYPYSVIGAGALILLLLVLLLVLAKRSKGAGKKGRSSSAGRGSAAKSGAPLRGMAVDGLSSAGEIDLQLVETIKNAPMGRVVLTPQHQEPVKPPVDPAILEAAVKACQEKFQEMYIEMYIGLGLMSDFEKMRTEVSKRIAVGEDTYHAMTELKMTPEGVVLMQWASVSGNILQSGEQHIGKGLLGIHGQELYSVYRYALNTMQEKGLATQAETQAKLDFMDRKIKELG